MSRFLAWVRWQRVPVSDMRIANPRREVTAVTLYAVVFVALSAATGLLIRVAPLPILGAASFIDDFWYVFLFKGVFLLCVPLVWYYRSGYRLMDLAPGWRPDARRVLTVIACLLVGLSVNLLQGRWGIVEEAASGFSTAALVSRVAVGILVPLVQAGFPEEFFFRGILQTRLEHALGRVGGILTSVTLFTAWHLPTRYLLANGVEGTAGDFGSVLLGTGLPVFLAGLVFALFWDRYRSLAPLVAAHWGVDIVPSIISFIGIDY